MDDLLLAGLMVLTGLLVGNELGTKLVVHPALAKLDLRGRGRVARGAPPLGPAALLARRP